MKWSIFVCLLVCLARFCDGLALKCPPGVTDPLCIEESREDSKREESRIEIAEAPEVQCLAGSEWDSNCHYCRCSDEGVAECLKQDICDKGVFAEPMLCKPNTTFQRDCNTCICLENGLGLCTLEYCRRSDSLGPTLEILDSDSKPNQKSVKSDIVVPTHHLEEQNVLDMEHKVVIFKRSTICKPLEEFMRDCNPCKCARDGLSYSCTHNECLETEVDKDKEVEVFMQNEGVDHVEQHTVCRASKHFYIGCNTCICNSVGTDYSCTNKPCPLPQDVELFHELKPTISTSSKNTTKAQVCEAKRMFIKDCNTCWCNDDGTSYYCTRRVCIPPLPDEEADLGGIPAEDLTKVKKECKPNEVFEIDCNTCRCNPDGKSYGCTRKACEDKYYEDRKNVTLSRKVRAFTTEPPKACQPGQEFRMDCNKCLCDNKGQDFSCTRIDCNALNNNHGSSAFTSARSKRGTSEQLSMKCVPGSVFDRGCNVCRCADNGELAACILKTCKDKKEEHTPESDEGFRCNPGEQFKRDCNDCTCSADGRSVFCTLRLCDQDLTPDI